jgi:hypothetical protein
MLGQAAAFEAAMFGNLGSRSADLRHGYFGSVGTSMPFGLDARGRALNPLARPVQAWGMLTADPRSNQPLEKDR